MSSTVHGPTQISAEALGIDVPSSPSPVPAGEEPPAAEPSPSPEPEVSNARRPESRMVISGAWEQELIISGAVVFALMQVPSSVDGAFRRLEPHLAGGTFTLALMGFQYVKLILYTLISAFVIHLASRAYWVGLIGLHSVFPGGVREDELKQGPVTREVYGRLTPTLPRAMAVTDDFCSTIFSFSFMMVAAFVTSIVWCVVMAAATWAVSRAFFGGVWKSEVFWGGFMLFGLAPAALAYADRWWGGRLRPGGGARRLLGGAITAFYHAYLMRLWGPISRVLFSNLPRRKAYGGFYAVLGLLVTFFVVSDVLSQVGMSAVVDGTRFAPDDDDARTVNAVMYEDQRPEDAAYSLAPSIPSDVIEGPYVRLFIPYSPRRQDAAVPERCPGVQPLSEVNGTPSDAQVSAVLACLGRIQRVWLNGRPLSGVPFRFRTDSRSGMRGIVAYVPTQGLPRGENLLTVERAPRPRADQLRVHRPAPPYSIRFWL
jgi:hypothetical protein